MKANFKVLTDIRKIIDEENRRTKKAASIALKKEGFLLAKNLKDDLRKGEVLGRKLAPLSQIARRTKTGRIKKNALKPLSSLAGIIRYKVDQTSDAGIAIGFVAPKMETRSWKELVMSQQEGGGLDVLYSGSRKYLGKKFARIGGKLKKRGDPDAKFFFLTRVAGSRAGAKGSLPKRPIVNPFWAVKEEQSKLRISENFDKKMRGERI